MQYITTDGSVCQMLMCKRSDNDAAYISIDDCTNSLQIIEYEHHEIHSGSSYTCSITQAVSDTNDRTIIAFRTPDSLKYLHLTASASATAAAVATIYEGPTITNNTGATLTVFNRNRTSTNTTGVWDTSQNPDVQGQATYFTEATMGNVTSGTAFPPIPLGAGQGPKAVGGLARGQQEYVLAPNTLYAFEVKSSTNDDNAHWIELDWYEHTDK